MSMVMERIVHAAFAAHLDTPLTAARRRIRLYRQWLQDKSMPMPYRSRVELVRDRHALRTAQLFEELMSAEESGAAAEESKPLDVVRSIPEAQMWFIEHAEGQVKCERFCGTSKVVSSFPEAEEFLREGPAPAVDPPSAA